MDSIGGTGFSGSPWPTPTKADRGDEKRGKVKALEEALKGEAEDRRDNLAHLRETVMQIETRMTTEEKICREALRDLPRVGPVEREAEVYGYCSSCRHWSDLCVCVDYCQN
ncbi:hypothetical protein OUZ56_010421 [Daphnia magna]|uniref:Uncharacterized protein n=1 Tax=Daphnia magna TaxID=35525 RepID=A0ABR0AIK2_9CRUS|nr:hypothetical protein OUZ56_010421 [Daphnia magna]